MKTKEELNSLKAEVETLNSKLRELTDEELEQVSGGVLSTAMTISEPGVIMPVVVVPWFGEDPAL